VGFAAASLTRADALGRLVPIVPATLHDMPEEELPEDARALLLTAEAVVAAAGAAWRPAAVVRRPTPRPRWTLTDLERQEEHLRMKEEAAAMGEPAPPAPPPPTEWWLLGPWDEVELDRTTWVVGTSTLCGYTDGQGGQAAGWAPRRLPGGPPAGGAWLAPQAVAATREGRASRGAG